MATAADSVSNNHSPRSPGFHGDGLSSPQFRRSPKNLSSPWVHVVRGESEAVLAAPSSPLSVSSQMKIPDSDYSPLKASSPPLSSDNSVVETQAESSDNANSNVSRAKKPAWNKPSNGAADVGPVMGADSWPALSEAIRALPKLSSDSTKVIPVVSQGNAIASSTQKHFTNNTNANSNPNRAFPARQKSMKCGSGPANGGFNQLPPPSVVDMSQTKLGKPGPMAPESSTRDPLHKSNNWESGPRGGFTSQPHIGNDHLQQRMFRRGIGGSHPRTDGPYHNTYGSKHEQDRGNHDWNHQRRDAHIQQQRVYPRGFIRTPPPGTGPVFGPLPVRPFVNPMGFHDMTSPVYYVRTPPPHEPFRSVPFVHAAPPAMFIPGPDPQLMSMIVKQIDYYFSSGNLCKDIFLRKNMDEQGWVPISLIAGFNRVKQLTSEIQLILDAVRTSTVVEVQGDKIRKRNDWMNWLLSSSNQLASVSGPQSPGFPNDDMLANHIGSIGLEEGKATNHNIMGPADPHTAAVPSKFSSAELNCHSETSSGEGTGSD